MNAAEGNGKAEIWGCHSSEYVDNFTTIRISNLGYNLASAGNATHTFFLAHMQLHLNVLLQLEHNSNCKSSKWCNI
jgi:hypothetical protein